MLSRTVVCPPLLYNIIAHETPWPTNRRRGENRKHTFPPRPPPRAGHCARRAGRSCPASERRPVQKPLRCLTRRLPNLLWAETKKKRNYCRNDKNVWWWFLRLPPFLWKVRKHETHRSSREYIQSYAQNVLDVMQPQTVRPTSSIAARTLFLFKRHRSTTTT